MPVLGRRQPDPTYQAAADLILDLPALMRIARARTGITLKTQAAQVGVGADTLTRVETGANITRDTIVACLRWLAVN